ncbi:mexicain-like [Durio zibethinus]|uniref:Mexicain-like n=1 Tax=Durio zibethinus TaxID=66656 RepID=A0A6P5XL79_DURZI|nr:mexicain-like [Durio zibethinus]
MASSPPVPMEEQPQTTEERPPPEKKQKQEDDYFMTYFDDETDAEESSESDGCEGEEFREMTDAEEKTFLAGFDVPSFPGVYYNDLITPMNMSKDIEKAEPILIPNGYPVHVDWRKKRILHLRNQGKMQSCWAMTTVSLLESVWSLKFNKAPSLLSPQMLVDCIQENSDELEGRRDCYKYSVVKALEWLKKNEVYGEIDYPYVKSWGKCLASSITPTVRVKIENYRTIVGEDRSQILMKVARRPVAVLIEAYQEFIYLKDEIYEGPEKETDEPPPLHAIIIVGYGTEGQGADAKNYWLVMNSWGSDWGVEGFGRVCRDTTVDEKFLLTRIAYPIFDEEKNQK